MQCKPSALWVRNSNISPAPGFPFATSMWADFETVAAALRRPIHFRWCQSSIVTLSADTTLRILQLIVEKNPRSFGLYGWQEIWNCEAEKKSSLKLKGRSPLSLPLQLTLSSYITYKRIISIQKCYSHMSWISSKTRYHSNFIIPIKSLDHD